MRGARRAMLAAAAGLLVGACAVTGTSPTPSASTSSPTTAVPRGPVIDRGLLAVLPVSVNGIMIEASPEAEATALTDSLLPGLGSALAAGIAFDGANGDFVYAVVVRLIPGALTDEAYTAWRQSYDEGACSQADGLDTTTISKISGRTVHVGACKGGLLTYHVWIKDKGLLISASAVGVRQLGEMLMGNLRP